MEDHYEVRHCIMRVNMSSTQLVESLYLDILMVYTFDIINLDSLIYQIFNLKYQMFTASWSKDIGNTNPFKHLWTLLRPVFLIFKRTVECRCNFKRTVECRCNLQRFKEHWLIKDEWEILDFSAENWLKNCGLLLKVSSGIFA